MGLVGRPECYGAVCVAEVEDGGVRILGKRERGAEVDCVGLEEGAGGGVLVV